MDWLKRKIDEQGYVLIAEVGVNYYDIAEKERISVMEAAKLMCREAKRAGADAVKFQTYKAGKIASRQSPSYWDTEEEPAHSQYELFLRYDAFGKEQYQELSEYCGKIGILFLSTPFDFESADYLDGMMNYFKISSSDITNIPFIRYITEKKKPIMLSTGASNEAEIRNAADMIRQAGCPLVLLHCILEYPTPLNHANLNRISCLKERYSDCIIGYSDHTKPDPSYDVLKAAYLLGAKVIEKHFTLDKTLKGNDHYHAMDAEDIIRIKSELDKLNSICGRADLEYLNSEDGARRNARRSLVLTRNIKKGEQIEESDITYKRPGTGISPEKFGEVVGKCAARDLEEDTILNWDDLEDK